MKDRKIFLILLYLILPGVAACWGQEAAPTKKLDQALAGGGTLPPTAGTPVEQRMAKMEEVLKQQNKEIDVLRRQLSAQEEGRLNKARADEIRQMVKDILCDEKFRNEIYQPKFKAGYDHGFYISYDDGDESFYLKTRMRSQFRYTGVKRQDKDPNFFGNRPVHDKSSFEFERLRLYFTGWLWDKNLKYVFGIEESTNNGDGNIKLYDAYFDYEYMKDQKILWGQYLLPFGKAAINASTFNQQLVDYSMATSVFNPGQSLGIQAHGDVLNKRLTYQAGVANGVRNPQDDSRYLDDKMAAVGRLVYHVLPGYDEIDETDYSYHTKPAMDVGASVLYNQNDGDIGPGGNGRNQLAYAVQDLIRARRGGYGNSPDAGSEYLQLGAEAGFKYKGLSITAEYFFRNVDSDHRWSAWNRLTAFGEGTSSPQGGYVQAGYFIIPKKLELAGRLGGVWGLGDDQSMEEAVGVNYYIKGHALKLQADVTHIDEVPTNNPVTGLNLNDRNIWMYRLQIQASMD